MTMSRTQLAQALSEVEIRKFLLGYFQEGLRQEVQQQLLELYETKKTQDGMTRMALARKIGRRAEQVTRWLSSASNLELDTISDLALALGAIPKVSFEPVEHLYSIGMPNYTNSVSNYVSEQRVMMTSHTATYKQAEISPLRGG